MLHIPRRSVLYMPASNERALVKARQLAADVIVFDLEDSVGPDKKVCAREQVTAALQAGGYGKRELVVRVNGISSSWWEDDIHHIANSGLDAICLPKVETVSEIDIVVQKLLNMGVPETLDIWIMIETPLGVMNIHTLASHPRVNVVVMGTTDLAKELRVPHTPDRIGLITALGQCVLSARVCDVDILDGVYLDLNDDKGFEFACQQGRNLGFDGKTLIHPNQLAIANQYFAPNNEELTLATKIIDAWVEAKSQGKAVAVVEGKLIESMHVDEAKRNLSIAEAIKELQASY